MIGRNFLSYKKTADQFDQLLLNAVLRIFRCTLMILAIDMGNTNIVLGGIDEKQTYFIERVTTDQGRTDTEYAIHFKNILEMHHIQLSDIEGAILF